MIKIIGPNWPSTRRLQDATTNIDGTLVVCWGTSGVPGALNATRRLNALEQLAAFRNAGLNVPAYTTSVEQAQEWVRDGRQVWGRRLFHTHGSDICGPAYRPPNRFGRRWLGREWWVEAVANVAHEYRVHIFKGRSIARGMKVQVEQPTRTLPVRSRSNGWYLQFRGFEMPDAVREAARMACTACGYDFAAIDVLWTQNGRAVVLEANKAPALLSDYTLNAYVGAIAKEARGQMT